MKGQLQERGEGKEQEQEGLVVFQLKYELESAISRQKTCLEENKAMRVQGINQEKEITRCLQEIDSLKRELQESAEQKREAQKIITDKENIAQTVTVDKKVQKTKVFKPKSPESYTDSYLEKNLLSLEEKNKLRSQIISKNNLLNRQDIQIAQLKAELLHKEQNKVQLDIRDQTMKRVKLEESNLGGSSVLNSSQQSLLSNSSSKVGRKIQSKISSFPD